MKLYTKFTLFLLPILSFHVCHGQFSQKDIIIRADSLLKTYKNANAPGMGFAILKEGKVIYKKTFGLANLENNSPITDSTAFNIASVSKQFTAFMALLAERDGKLSLDDDIRTYLPELELGHKITIRQLANHTNGLPNISEIKKLQGFGDEFKITNSEAVHTLLQIKHLNFLPGTQYQYNNTGFTLLAEILRSVYKKDFNTLLTEYITGPLQMKNTVSIADPDKIIPNKAESYYQKGNAFFKLPIGQMVSGSSNIYTTLNDLCVWAANFYHPVVGSSALYDEMKKNTVLRSGKQIEYGLGLQTESYKGTDIVFHGGGTVGYRSYILNVPSQQLSVIMLGNKQGFEGLLIAYQLVDFFLQNQHKFDERPQQISHTPAALQQLAGIYQINPGNYLDISAEGKNLYIGTYGNKGKEQLQVMGAQKFKITSIPTASLTFHRESADLRIADFTYNAKRTKLNAPKIAVAALHKFVGFYRNEEFNTIYQLLIDNDKLVARHPLNGDIQLKPLLKNSFYSTTEYFGQLDFKFDKHHNAIGFNLSGANMLNIQFKKLK